MTNFWILTTYIALVGLAAAHLEVARVGPRQYEISVERRTLDSCTGHLEDSGYYKRELDRRTDRANYLRSLQGSPPLLPRDINPTLIEYGLLGRDIVARQQQAGCVLDPEVTEGPFWVAGELVRSDVTEGVPGVPLHLDINLIDVTTCSPIPDVYVELWGANSTGVYSGVLSSANGVGLSDADNINNSALRGVQPTNENGTTSFQTIVPGHYTGRANHLHTIVHLGATLLPNNTIQGGTITHVGQFYLDQTLLQSVEATSPYASNTQALVTNAADMIFRQGSASGNNPIIQATMLGATVEEGLYGFIDVAVNPSARRTPSPVNTWTADGGKPVAGSPWAGYPWFNKARSILRRWML